MSDEIRVRQARHDDAEGVAAIAADTWPERGDYVADVFPVWVDSDGPDQRTFVAEAGETVVGLVQAVRLSEWEAWYQGMRVDPDWRGRGVSGALNDACVTWSRGWGAKVGRLMVFSWNTAGLGAARANGFEPVTEFRWIHPEPDPDAAPEGRVVEDPDAAYAYWTDSDARDHLGGLALDSEETWACSELTRETLHRTAEETRVFAVQRRGGFPGGSAKAGAGTRAASVRVRDYERETDDGTVKQVEYGVAAWDDVDALRELLAAISRDAAEVGADDVRVLVPETPRHVTDAAYAGAGVADEPDFVLAMDLS